MESTTAFSGGKRYKRQTSAARSQISSVSRRVSQPSARWGLTSSASALAPRHILHVHSCVGEELGQLAQAPAHRREALLGHAHRAVGLDPTRHTATTPSRCTSSPPTRSRIRFITITSNGCTHTWRRTGREPGEANSGIRVHDDSSRSSTVSAPDLSRARSGQRVTGDPTLQPPPAFHLVVGGRQVMGT
jgi:hypothetical protein